MKYTMWELHRYIRNLVDSVQGHSSYFSRDTYSHLCPVKSKPN